MPFVGTVDNTIKLRGSFYISAVLTDPTTITLTIRNPNNADTVLTYASGAVTRESLGVYSYSYAPSVAGNYTYSWVGAGAVVAKGFGSFDMVAGPSL